MPYIYIDSVPKMSLPRSGHCMYDEMWSVIDSRASASHRNKIVADILLRSRKRDLTYCLLPDEDIMTNNGVKKISDIKIGDYVLTHTGTFKKVLQLHKRKYSGDVFKITPRRLCLGVNLTENHKIFTEDGEKRADELKLDDKLIYPIIKKTKDVDFIKISDFHKEKTHKTKTKGLTSELIYLKNYEKIKKELIKRGKTRRQSIKLGWYIKNKSKKEGGKYGWRLHVNKWFYSRFDSECNDIIKIDNNFMEFMGYFLSDGSTSMDCGDVTIAFGLHEYKYAKRTQELFKTVFGTKSILSKRNGYNIYTVRCSSVPISNFLRQNFGTNSHDKHVPEWFLVLPKEKQKIFVDAYIVGDGHIGKNGCVQIVTVSKHIVYVITQMLLRNGIYVRVHKQKANEYANTNKKLKHFSYHICYSLSNKNMIGKIKDNNLVLPIKSIEKNKYKGLVYNIGVEEDHSYTTFSFAILNCFTSQMLDLLDKRLRKILDFTAYTILNPQETIGKCFREGTQIIANPEIKNIEDVFIGEKILTHAGNFMPVENTTSRLYDGDLYKILPYYMPFPVEVTGNHPILVAEPSFKKSRNTNWHNDDKFLIDNFFTMDSHKIVDFLRNRTYSSIHYRKHMLKKQISFSLKWKNAEEITQKDLLAYPINRIIVDKDFIKISDYLNKTEWKTEGYDAKSFGGIKGWNFENGIWKNARSKIVVNDEIKIDSDFLKLAGYFIGDGSVNGNGNTLTFYFNRKEKGNIMEIKRLMKNIFNIECKIYEHKNSQETFVYTRCIILCKLFGKLFGKYSHNKKMPDWFLQLPEEKLKYVIEGLVLSDGYIRKKTKMIVTTSKILAIQIVNSMIKMKKRFNCQHSKPKISAKVNGIHDTYSIYFDVKNSKFLFFHGDYILYPIKLIEKNNYLGMVYNLQVQNDESYVTPSLTAHNCLIFRGGYPKEGMILKTMRFYTRGVFDLYQTNEEIDMKPEDDGSSPLIIFQESPEHPPKYFDTYEACDKFAESYYAKHPELLSLLMAGQ